MTVSVRSVLSVPLLSASIRRRNGGLSRTAAIRSIRNLPGAFLPDEPDGLGYGREREWNRETQGIDDYLVAIKQKEGTGAQTSALPKGEQS